jgi:hypothetical protein
MRKLVLLAALIPLASTQAQPVPSRFGYQGRLVDRSGAPLDGVHQVKFTIYKEAQEGTPLWDETQKLALTNGFYSTFLGAVKPLPVGYDSTVFNGSDLYLGIAVDGTEELTPRQQIGAVVYALRTAWAARATEADHAVQADRAATATNVGGGGDVTAKTIRNSAGSLSADEGGNLRATSARIDGNLTATSATINENLTAKTVRNSNETFVADEKGALKAGNATVNGYLHVTGNTQIDGILPGRVLGGGHAGCSSAGNVTLVEGWGLTCSSSSRCTGTGINSYTLPGSYTCQCSDSKAAPHRIGTGIFLCVERRDLPF